METYKVKLYDIDYCVEDEDVCSKFDNDVTIEEDSEEYYEAIHNEIIKIKKELPKEVIVDVECEEEDLETVACDMVSEKTGWLINGFKFNILQKGVN